MGSVDDALASLASPGRECLQRVVAVARATTPDAVDGVSYAEIVRLRSAEITG